MTAPFTAEQENRLRHFEQAPPAPESAVERVARALWAAELEQPYPWEDADDHGSREDYRRLARAALAAMQGPDDAAAAVQRVEALAEEMEDDVEEHAEWRTRMAIRQIVADLRAALRGDA